MNTAPRKINVFQFNPPLKVLASHISHKGIGTEDFQFARPKLKRQIAHERVSRYFQKSNILIKPQLA